jgi:AraC-like DNA-binding protein
MAYLTEWRMRLAGRALREDGAPVSVLARSLGYTSESAFSNAFKRMTGSSPKSHRSGPKARASSGKRDKLGGVLYHPKPSRNATNV